MTASSTGCIIAETVLWAEQKMVSYSRHCQKEFAIALREQPKRTKHRLGLCCSLGGLLREEPEPG